MRWSRVLFNAAFLCSASLAPLCYLGAEDPKVVAKIHFGEYPPLDYLSTFRFTPSSVRCTQADKPCTHWHGHETGIGIDTNVALNLYEVSDSGVESLVETIPPGDNSVGGFVAGKSLQLDPLKVYSFQIIATETRPGSGTNLRYNFFRPRPDWCEEEVDCEAFPYDCFLCSADAVTQEYPTTIFDNLRFSRESLTVQNHFPRQPCRLGYAGGQFIDFSNPVEWKVCTTNEFVEPIFFDPTNYIPEVFGRVFFDNDPINDPLNPYLFSAGPVLTLSYHHMYDDRISMDYGSNIFPAWCMMPDFPANYVGLEALLGNSTVLPPFLNKGSCLTHFVAESCRKNPVIFGNAMPNCAHTPQYADCIADTRTVTGLTYPPTNYPQSSSASADSQAPLAPPNGEASQNNPLSCIPVPGEQVCPAPVLNQYDPSLHWTPLMDLGGHSLIRQPLSSSVLLGNNHPTTDILTKAGNGPLLTPFHRSEHLAAHRSYVFPINFIGLDFEEGTSGDLVEATKLVDAVTSFSESAPRIVIQSATAEKQTVSETAERIVVAVSGFISMPLSSLLPAGQPKESEIRFFLNGQSVGSTPINHHPICPTGSCSEHMQETEERFAFMKTIQIDAVKGSDWHDFENNYLLEIESTPNAFGNQARALISIPVVFYSNARTLGIPIAPPNFLNLGEISPVASTFSTTAPPPSASASPATYGMLLTLSNNRPAESVLPSSNTGLNTDYISERDSLIPRSSCLQMEAGLCSNPSRLRELFFANRNSCSGSGKLLGNPLFSAAFDGSQLLFPDQEFLFGQTVMRRSLLGLADTYFNGSVEGNTVSMLLGGLSSFRKECIGVGGSAIACPLPDTMSAEVLYAPSAGDEPLISRGEWRAKKVSILPGLDVDCYEFEHQSRFRYLGATAAPPSDTVNPPGSTSSQEWVSDVMPPVIVSDGAINEMARSKDRLTENGVSAFRIRVGIPQFIANEMTDPVVYVNGQPSPIKHFALGDYAGYYVVDSLSSSKPKLFIASANPLLPNENRIPGLAEGDTAQAEVFFGPPTTYSSSYLSALRLRTDLDLDDDPATVTLPPMWAQSSSTSASPPPSEEGERNEPPLPPSILNSGSNRFYSLGVVGHMPTISRFESADDLIGTGNCDSKAFQSSRPQGAVLMIEPDDYIPSPPPAPSLGSDTQENTLREVTHEERVAMATQQFAALAPPPPSSLACSNVSDPQYMPPAELREDTITIPVTAEGIHQTTAEQIWQPGERIREIDLYRAYFSVYPFNYNPDQPLAETANLHWAPVAPGTDYFASVLLMAWKHECFGGLLSPAAISRDIGVIYIAPDQPTLIEFNDNSNPPRDLPLYNPNDLAQALRNTLRELYNDDKSNRRVIRGLGGKRFAAFVNEHWDDFLAAMGVPNVIPNNILAESFFNSTQIERTTKVIKTATPYLIGTFELGLSFIPMLDAIYNIGMVYNSLSKGDFVGAALNAAPFGIDHFIRAAGKIRPNFSIRNQAVYATCLAVSARNAAAKANARAEQACPYELTGVLGKSSHDNLRKISAIMDEYPEGWWTKISRSLWPAERWRISQEVIEKLRNAGFYDTSKISLQHRYEILKGRGLVGGKSLQHTLDLDNKTHYLKKLDLQQAQSSNRYPSDEVFLFMRQDATSQHTIQKGRAYSFFLDAAEEQQIFLNGPELAAFLGVSIHSPLLLHNCTSGVQRIIDPKFLQPVYEQAIKQHPKGLAMTTEEFTTLIGRARPFRPGKSGTAQQFTELITALRNGTTGLTIDISRMFDYRSLPPSVQARLEQFKFYEPATEADLFILAMVNFGDFATATQPLEPLRLLMRVFQKSEADLVNFEQLVSRVNSLTIAELGEDAYNAIVSARTLAAPPSITCGNGLLELGEICDDGNSSHGDGCSAQCERECVNCDDGVECTHDRCNSLSGRCESERIDGCGALCGNSIVESEEQCDDGNQMVGDGCSNRCQREPVCVNGCDDGDPCTDDLCVGMEECRYTPSESCNPVCGNYSREGREECDDGNTLSGDGCAADCTIEQTPHITGPLVTTPSVDPRVSATATPTVKRTKPQQRPHLQKRGSTIRERSERRNRHRRAKQGKRRRAALVTDQGGWKEKRTARNPQSTTLLMFA